MGTTHFIGIDLGTTYSAVAVVNETGRCQIVADRDGSNITPSAVAFREEGGKKVAEVGEEARRAIGIDPNVAARFKRDMGEPDQNRRVLGQEYTPTELSAFVLKRLVADAEAALGGQVGGAVITIPANFGQEARAATAKAAQQAGVDVLGIINEPTAAALYYAQQTNAVSEGTYAVYDLGGGTFDVTILDIFKGATGELETHVRISNGIHQLGGTDFDEKLRQLVFKKYEEATGEPLDEEDFTLSDAEAEKKSLSKRDRVKIRVNKKMLEITRSEFEEAISALVVQTKQLCEVTVQEETKNRHGSPETLSLNDITNVFLVGGSTRVPAVRKAVGELFGEQKIIDQVNVDEAVALGAALWAIKLAPKDMLPALVADVGRKIAVQETANKYFGTTAVSRTASGFVVENVIIIPKGAVLPCSVTRSFSVHEEQSEVELDITESATEETDPKWVNKIYSEMMPLKGNRSGVTEFTVTYSYDVNQIMECAFCDVASGLTVTLGLNPMTGDVSNKDSSVGARPEHVASGPENKNNAADKAASIEDFIIE